MTERDPSEYEKITERDPSSEHDGCQDPEKKQDDEANSYEPLSHELSLRSVDE